MKTEIFEILKNVDLFFFYFCYVEILSNFMKIVIF